MTRSSSSIHLKLLSEPHDIMTHTSSFKLSTTLLTSLLGVCALLIPATASAKKPIAKIKGTVSVNASLSHGTLPNYASSEVYASIKLTGSDFVSEDRAPLNVALVMDRSSSMAGEKIRQSRLAALALLEQLGPDDRLSVISYGSDVTLEISSRAVTAKNRPLLEDAIKGIQSSGMTNLSGGLEQGCEMVADSLSKSSVNRVILMSDGKANRGVTEPLSLAGIAGECLENGVSVTTIGLGLNYNEDVMTQMAMAGAGNYHFIDDEKAMARVFEQEATGLSATVARNAKLVVELAPGVELLKLHGYRYKEKGTRITVPLSEFSSRQRKDVLMRLSVSAQESGERSVISMKLTYDDVLNAESVSKRSKLTADISGEREVVAKHVNKDVFSHAQKVEVADTMRVAMDEYEKGNTAKAEKLIEERRTAMKQAAATYDFADDDLDAYKRVDEELEQTNEVMKSAPASSSSGKKLRKAKKKRSYDISNSAEMF